MAFKQSLPVSTLPRASLYSRDTSKLRASDIAVSIFLIFAPKTMKLRMCRRVSIISCASFCAPDLGLILSGKARSAAFSEALPF